MKHDYIAQDREIVLDDFQKSLAYVCAHKEIQQFFFEKINSANLNGHYSNIIKLANRMYEKGMLNIENFASILNDPCSKWFECEFGVPVGVILFTPDYIEEHGIYYKFYFLDASREVDEQFVINYVNKQLM